MTLLRLNKTVMRSWNLPRVKPSFALLHFLVPKKLVLYSVLFIMLRSKHSQLHSTLWLLCVCNQSPHYPPICNKWVNSSTRSSLCNMTTPDMSKLFLRLILCWRHFVLKSFLPTVSVEHNSIHTYYLKVTDNKNICPHIVVVQNSPINPFREYIVCQLLKRRWLFLTFHAQLPLAYEHVGLLHAILGFACCHLDAVTGTRH